MDPSLGKCTIDFLAVRASVYRGSSYSIDQFITAPFESHFSLSCSRNAPHFRRILNEFGIIEFQFVLFLTLYLFNLAEGHVVSYDREAPFELRIQDPNSGPQEVGTLEAIRVKVLNLVSTFLFQNIDF